MPILEYYCPETHTIYAFYARRQVADASPPRCPDPRGKTMRRVLSSFTITRSREEKAETVDSGDDTAMEAAMAELEQEMAGMDEENPDPRQMGRLLRRMSEVTGEPLDGQMEEMARKLEEGMDPEELEAALDDGEFPEAEDGEGPEADGPASRRKWLRWIRGAKEPRRDPGLYEWDDYAG